MRTFFTRFSIATVIILAAIVWGGTLWLLGQPLSWEYLKPFSITLTIVLAVLTAFDRVLWHLPIIRWFVPVPDLRGTWRAELQSTYKHADGSPVGLIEGEAVIRQTFSSLSIRLKTGSSASVLKTERLDIQADGHVEIYGVYQNDPQIQLRGATSEIHYGAFKYSVVDRNATVMEGTYWTDRITKGSIKLTKTGGPETL